MKKLFFVFAAMAMLVSLPGCNSCSRQKNEDPEVKGIVVENTISTDREDVFLNYGKVYEWFETSVTLKSFLDEENDGSVEQVLNVFQVIKKDESEKAVDTDVVIFTHSEALDTVDVVKHTLWFEDFRLNEEEINLTFAEAFERFNEANCPKPHSKYVVLRKPVGPAVTNALYIFGNTVDHVFVDAKTGDVLTEDPGYKWIEDSPAEHAE